MCGDAGVGVNVNASNINGAVLCCGVKPCKIVRIRVRGPFFKAMSLNT